MTEREVDFGAMGLISPGVRAGAEGSSSDWGRSTGILSASAELEGVVEFAGIDVSDCNVCSGVSEAFAELDELSAIVAGSVEVAGCDVFGCGREAGDLAPLLVGREGKKG
jgi:hypothetical protein